MRGQTHSDTRFLHTGGGIVGTQSLHVGGVGEHAAGVVLELVPLRNKVVAAVVANLVDQLAVRVADLINMRAVDHDFAAIGNGRLHLVHAFGGGPEIVIHLGHDRKHSAEGLLHPPA